MGCEEGCYHQHKKLYDEKCFVYAIIPHENPVEFSPQRVTKILRMQSEKYDMKGCRDASDADFGHSEIQEE
jgi:hypothetical protein